MRRVIALLFAVALAACGQDPDPAQLRRDLEARLATAFPGQVLSLDALDRQGRMEQLDGARIVHFKARLKVEKPLDLGQWGGPNAQLLAGVMGAGSAGISGLTQGGNKAGDTLTVFGTLPYRPAQGGGGWAAAAAPPPAVIAQTAGPPGQLTGPERLLATLAETLRAAPGNTQPTGARVVEEELEIARRNIEARLARLGAGFPLAAGSPGGAYFRLATALAADMQGRGVRLAVLPTAGSVENLNLLREGRATLAFAQADVAALAAAGKGPFAETGAHDGLRALLALFPEQLHVVVRADDPAQDISGLAGRRAALGLAGSGSRVTATEVLEAAGVPVVQPEGTDALDPRAALAALAARRVDAVFVVGAAPFPPVVEAFGAASLRLLPLDAALAQRLVGAGVVTLAIPAGAYSLQTQPVPTLAVAALLLADESLTEAEVRRVGEAVLGRVGSREREPLALMVAPGSAGLGIPVPLHRGAVGLPGVAPR
jgi:TRAP transporter TAXI family solute receptor